MIRALLKAAAVAGVSSAAYKIYKSGKLDGLIDEAGRRIGPALGLRRTPALDSAYTGANASRPAVASDGCTTRSEIRSTCPLPWIIRTATFSASIGTLVRSASARIVAKEST